MTEREVRTVLRERLERWRTDLTRGPTRMRFQE